MRHTGIAALAVFVILFTAWRVQNPRSLPIRNGQSGTPISLLQNTDASLQDASKIKGLPILIITAEKDIGLPTNQQAAALASAVGPSCQYVTVSGAKHNDARLLDGKRIKAFLSSHHTPKQITVVVNPQDIDMNVSSLLRSKERCEFFSTTTMEFTNTSLPSSLETRYAKTSGVAFVCTGIGAPVVWRFAERYPKKVTCIVAISPFTSLPLKQY